MFAHIPSISFLVKESVALALPNALEEIQKGDLRGRSEVWGPE
jgi:hypothetical protein